MSELLKITRELCAINSATGSGNWPEIESYCRGYLGAGQKIETTHCASGGPDRDFLFTRRGTGSARIMLLGHYDTVPAKSYRQKMLGGKLFAPGSYDMKGGLAIALKLFATLDSREFSQLDLYLAGDEEWRRKPLVIPGEWSAILSFEGGERGRLVAARFGAGMVDLSLSGETLRASYPAAGANSILALASLLLAIEKANNDQAHFTASGVQAQAAINVIPEQSAIRGILRYQSALARQEFLSCWPKRISGVKISCHFQELIPAWEAEAKSPSRQLIAGLGDWEATTRTGAGDISWLQQQAAITIDGLGPHGGDEHSDHEYIVIDSLEEQYRLAEKIIKRIV